MKRRTYELPPKPVCIHGPGDAVKCGHPDCAFWTKEMEVIYQAEEIVENAIKEY